MTKLIKAEIQVKLLIDNKLFYVNLHIAQKNDQLFITVGAVYDADKFELLLNMFEAVFFRPNLVEQENQWTRIFIDRVSHSFTPKVDALKAKINYDTHTLFQFKIGYQIEETNLEENVIRWLRAGIPPEETI